MVYWNRRGCIGWCPGLESDSEMEFQSARSPLSSLGSVPLKAIILGKDGLLPEYKAKASGSMWSSKVRT